jgi:hypothetical protein
MRTVLLTAGKHVLSIPSNAVKGAVEGNLHFTYRKQFGQVLAWPGSIELEIRICRYLA